MTRCGGEKAQPGSCHSFLFLCHSANKSCLEIYTCLMILDTAKKPGKVVMQLSWLPFSAACKRISYEGQVGPFVHCLCLRDYHTTMDILHYCCCTHQKFQIYILLHLDLKISSLHSFSLYPTSMMSPYLFTKKNSTFRHVKTLLFLQSFQKKKKSYLKLKVTLSSLRY